MSCCCSLPLSCCETCLNRISFDKPWSNDMKITSNVFNIPVDGKKNKIIEEYFDGIPVKTKVVWRRSAV